MRRRWFALSAAAAIATSTVALAQSSGLAPRLERLASRGNAEAAYHLGMLYNNGLGVGQDPRRAFQYFRRAAEGGDPLGAYKLGCYYAGQFGSAAVTPNERLALRWKLVAARAGYSLAQLDVAVDFARREQWAEALPWFEAAARQGEAQALYNLSVMYTDSLGVEASRPRAWAYFRLSQFASRGHLTENARRALGGMWAAMTTPEQEEAQRIAATFVTGPTEITRRAFGGLARAEAVAAAR